MDHALQRLTNEQWGFETNCFVCEPTNEKGLRIPFFHDVAHQEVLAEFTLDSGFSGAPRYVHGGVITSLLDEAMAWATIAIAHRFAMTRELNAVSDRPIRIGFTYNVRARIKSTDDDRIATCAEVTDHKDRRCARADAVFSVLGLAQVAAATGQEPAQVIPGYIRPPTES
jgi:acyl-coenzyme A thioesterase PaaI-like protein